jgi:hypothetical protein
VPQVAGLVQVPHEVVELVDGQRVDLGRGVAEDLSEQA